MRCSNCGLLTHSQANCPRTHRGSTRRFHMRCYYCGSRKHTMKVCPKTASGARERAHSQPHEIQDEYIED